MEWPIQPQEKVTKYLGIPINGSVTEVKNTLEDIAKDACWQDPRQFAHYGMLSLQAVLVFIDKKARVVGQKQVVDVLAPSAT